MRTCISIAQLVTVGLLVPAILSCGSSDEPPAYVPFNNTKPTTTPNKDSGTDADSGVDGTGDCSVVGTAGCPCTTANATADCGRIDYVSGDYVTCVMGTSICDGTQWGPCVGNRIVAQNYPGHSLTSSGIQLLSTTMACNIPCDPACSKVVGQPTTDVDAGTLTISDAGVAITATTGTGPGSGPCKGLWCQVNSCQGQPKTSLSGVVYDPAGKNPLYNAYVYVPVDPTVALPAFATGASCDTCSGAGNVSAISLAQTGPDGKFTLTNVPAGANVALVVQMGKWRRMVMLPTLTACTNNVVDPSNSRLPRNHTDGYNNLADIPKIAIATGSADPFECLLLKAGIDPNEIKAPGNNTRVEYYVENGANLSPSAPNGSTLTGSLTTLKQYDVVLLPCEGSENDAHVTDVPNLASFADIGGRVFTTHFGYSWLATPTNGVAKNKSEFYGTADWSKLNQNDYNDPMTAMIDQSFPKGVAYAQWLQNLGATTSLGSMTINQPRHDARSTINPPSQRWVYGSSKSATGGTPDMLLGMTFNTPTTATQDKQCGRVVYSDFHVSADALVSGTTCTANTDCGFGATCGAPTVGTCSAVSCQANSGCSTGYSCAGASQGSCTTQTCYANSDCGTGRTCPGGQTGSCNVGCFANTDCSNVKSTSKCSGATQGTCSALSCTTNASCGVGTCTGSSAGTCSPNAMSCWAASDCTSINSKFTCTGEVNGACSAATCKTTADCGTGTCTSPAAVAGTCKFPTTSCWANTDCTSINASATCGGAQKGTCSASTCKSTADCGTGTCTSPAPTNGTCTHPAETCFAASDCTGITGATCSNPVFGSCSATTCKSATDCGAGSTCSSPAPTNGTCTHPAESCFAASDCTGIAGATCNWAVAGSCSAPTCKADADCGAGSTCSSPAPTNGTCTPPTESCFTVADCTGINGATCGGVTNGTCAAGTCHVNTDCGNGTCSGSHQGTCKWGVFSAGACWSTADCTGAYTCQGVTNGACSLNSCATSTDCGGRTCNGAKAGSCSGPTGSCNATSDCSSLGSAYTCTGGSLGGCANPTCKTNTDCGTGSTCTSPAPKTGSCTAPAESCWTASDCTGINGATCGSVKSGTCAAASCKTNTDCGSGTCAGATQGLCYNGTRTNTTKCWTNTDCTTGKYTTCLNPVLGSCSLNSCTSPTSATDCGASRACNGSSQGTCSGGTGSCINAADCSSLGTAYTCTGGAVGTCTTPSCTSSTTCGGSRTCVGAVAGSCSGGSGTCINNADCSSLGSAYACSGGALGTCTNPSCTSTANCGASRTCVGAAAGSCLGGASSCITTSDCSSLGSAYSCSGGVMGTCTNPTCTSNTNCGGSRTCVGAVIGSCSGPSPTCYGNSDCTALGTGYTCNGGAMGTCTNPSCTSNSNCGTGRTCQGQKAGACTGPTGSCWQTSDCSSSLGAGYSCNNAVTGSCSSVSCTSNANCGSSRTCQNAVAGSCSLVSKTCDVASDCTQTYGSTAVCNGSSASTCAAGGCFANSDCGASGSCSNAKLGTCQETCTSDANCGGLKCVSGICQGCLGSGCPTGSSCGGYKAATCSASASTFPLECRNGDLSAQEKALEFMLFDLSACVSPDSWTPPEPGVSFGPVTFNLDFMANCPADQRPIWREFDWQAQIPSSADITFNVQTADLASGLTSAPSVLLAKATTSTALPNFDVAIIDTTGGGAFETVNPPLMSKQYLRVATTLDPTSDNKDSPTLINWEVHYDCEYDQ